MILYWAINLGGKKLKQAVIFDMDGVLVNTESFILKEGWNSLMN